MRVGVAQAHRRGFLDLNGRTISLTDDEAFTLVVHVAAGSLRVMNWHDGAHEEALQPG